MTQPDPLDTIRSAISTLERTVNGDASLGLKSLRDVTNELKKGIEAIEDERREEKAEQRGQKRVLAWIFGTSAASAVGLIVLLIKTLGGGA